MPKQNVSHTINTSYYTNTDQFRAEEMGYFDLEYQFEQNISNGSIVNANKHVYYCDVYIFIDRLKDLIIQHDVKISSYLRDFVLI